MPKAGELKKGVIVEIDDQLYLTRKIDVRSPSSRGANTLYKVTFMNIQKKQKLEQTFTGTDYLKEADCTRRSDRGHPSVCGLLGEYSRTLGGQLVNGR